MFIRCNTCATWKACLVLSPSARGDQWAIVYIEQRMLLVRAKLIVLHVMFLLWAGDCLADQTHVISFVSTQIKVRNLGSVSTKRTRYLVHIACCVETWHNHHEALTVCETMCMRPGVRPWPASLVSISIGGPYWGFFDLPCWRSNSPSMTWTMLHNTSGGSRSLTTSCTNTMVPQCILS